MKTRLLLLSAAACVPLHAAPKNTAPEGVKIERDVDYLTPGRVEKLDLYQPDKTAKGKKLPAVVIIHGGGWVGGKKDAQREFITGTTLAKAGYVCASVEYWKNEDKRWPTNLQDCKNAVRWLRVNAEKLNVDPDHIGVIGGSAGGHLALMVAYTPDNKEIDPNPLYPAVSDRVSACVNMYGISDLMTREKTDATGKATGKPSHNDLFPESRETAPEKWKLTSPVTHVRKDSPPTMTLHGTADTTVDREQSKELDKVLKEAGADSTLIMVEGANHAWPLKTDKFDYTDEVTAFFDKHLKAPAK